MDEDGPVSVCVVCVCACMCVHARGVFECLIMMYIVV